MSISEEEHNKRIFWYKKGLIDRKIAEKVNRTKQTIYNWRKTHGLEANGKNKKISVKKIKKILSYNKQGFSISEIARKVGCSNGSVYYWINKKAEN
ncbi:MAG: helix-turn-helix domain-containing protein [Halanaerobium sp.]